MKKYCLLLIFAVLLAGCSSRGAVETVNDELLQPVLAPQSELVLSLPEDAALEVMENDAGKLYFCDGYTLTVQTLPAGDMDRTVRTLCGFGSEEVDIVETRNADIRRSDWVWTAAGEGGDYVCRGAVLDDGNYHYCVTAMTQATSAAMLESQWSGLFASLKLG